jgi:hypothetical protein
MSGEGGEWMVPSEFGALADIADEFGVTDAGRFTAALIESGLVIRERYYVPSARELLGLMKQLSYHLRRSNHGCRWVMCRETHDALAKRWTGQRVPAPMTFDSSFWRSAAGAELPPAAIEMEVLQVIEDRRYWDDHSMLFGMPIRIDPAARSPLFEVDSEATR